MNIAIVGATGMVGQKFLQLIEERNFPAKEIRPFASQKNEGKKIFFRSQEWTLQTLKEGCFNNLDIVFFSSGEEISLKWAPKAAQAGALVIDNSSAFRMEKHIPLVVPEVNGEQLAKLKRGVGDIIANPNCSTIQLVLALNPLNSSFGLESVHVSSYQSLSGAGQKTLTLLKQESQAILDPKGLISENSGKVIPALDKINPKGLISVSLPSDVRSYAFNCIPQIGTINENGFSTEETKLMRETKKILNLPDLKISATAVRVPTFNGHGEAVIVTFKKPANKEEVIMALEKQENLTVLQGEHIPHQRFVDEKDDVYVGRIRTVPESEGKSWMMWIAADNLRKGAALNGLQIAEILTKLSEQKRES
ncbi:MAG: aspartate-semialdehyde dehydrogenase [Bdellovibrionales bacterium]|nr:aspartate-semialdehyde dehydrogenase [Bdellovibrionales bacterium]